MAGIRYKGQIFSGAAAFGTADHVAYDNTQSGLAATDVQGALDEIADDLGQVIGTWTYDALDAKTYGTLTGYINLNMKIALIYWAGNATAAPTDSITISIPNKYTPMREFVVPMKDSASGSWMSVRPDPVVVLTLKGTAWTNATLMYPLA